MQSHPSLSFKVDRQQRRRSAVGAPIAADGRRAQLGRGYIWGYIFGVKPIRRIINRSVSYTHLGGRAELIGPSAEIGALRVLGGLNRLLPIAEILPIQMLTLALALNAGFEPGRFLHATKVTTEE